jgi:hypothetical protein
VRREQIEFDSQRRCCCGYGRGKVDIVVSDRAIPADGTTLDAPLVADAVRPEWPGGSGGVGGTMPGTGGTRSSGGTTTAIGTGGLDAGTGGMNGTGGILGIDGATPACGVQTANTRESPDVLLVLDRSTSMFPTRSRPHNNWPMRSLLSSSSSLPVPSAWRTSLPIQTTWPSISTRA